MTTVDQAIRIARQHIGSGYMDSSARLCLADAERIVEEYGDLRIALERAAKSLAYSVGVGHRDYVRVKRAHQRMVERMERQG